MLLNKFCFITVRLKGTLIQTNRLINNTIDTAQNLIELLKKEYKLQ
jgi:hypothetical protein